MNIEDRLRLIIQEELEVIKDHITMVLSQSHQKEDSRYLSRKEVAKYLGIAISTVDYWKRTKRLNSVDVNGMVRFDKRSIDAGLKEGALSKYNKA